MKVFRFDGLTINGNPVKVTREMNGATLLDPLDFAFVEVGDKESFPEAVEFYGMSVLGLERVDSFNWTDATLVGVSEGN